MNNFIEHNLNESSLKRIWQHTQEHDTATITAFRFARDCGTGVEYTKRENLQRNKSLLAKIQRLGYGVTSVKGSYIENYKTKNAREVGENTFFLVDLKDGGKLEKDVRKLGEEFDQDSVMFIEKGGNSARLIGTNHCEDGYPGYGKIEKYTERHLGKSGKFFSRVSGRPFMFESISREHIPVRGYFGKMALESFAEKHWSQIETDE